MFLIVPPAALNLRGKKKKAGETWFFGRKDKSSKTLSEFWSGMNPPTFLSLLCPGWLHRRSCHPLLCILQGKVPLLKAAQLSHRETSLRTTCMLSSLVPDKAIFCGTKIDLLAYSLFLAPSCTIPSLAFAQWMKHSSGLAAPWHVHVRLLDLQNKTWGFFS